MPPENRIRERKLQFNRIRLSSLFVQKRLLCDPTQGAFASFVVVMSQPSVPGQSNQNPLPPLPVCSSVVYHNCVDRLCVESGVSFVGYHNLWKSRKEVCRRLSNSRICLVGNTSSPRRPSETARSRSGKIYRNIFTKIFCRAKVRPCAIHSSH